MKFTIDPDRKARFVDPQARTSGALVHTVEVSGERSLAPFITLFFTGRTADVDAFLAETGLDFERHHDPAIYHNDDRECSFVGEFFPDERPGEHRWRAWTFHWHKRLDRQPVLEDVDVYAAGIPSGLMEEIREYYA